MRVNGGCNELLGETRTNLDATVQVQACALMFSTSRKVGSAWFRL